MMSITRAMKLMFLLEKLFELKGVNNLDYISYKLGPFAEDFQINMTPLISEQIISYKEEYIMNSTHILLDSKKIYQINLEREEEIENVLKNNYINKSEFKKDIELMKLLSEVYDSEHLTDLIQVCYFLKPDFTKNSIIKEEIRSYSKQYNQEIILKMLSILDEEYIIKLLSNIEGILELFSITDENKEKNSFYLILENFYKAIKTNDKINKEDLIRTIDNISINDINESYKFLKYKLLEIASFEKSNFYNFEYKRKFLIFLLKTLQLSYPLNKKSLEKLRKLSKELKDSLEFMNYEDELSKLDLNLQELKEEIYNKENKKYQLRKQKVQNIIKKKKEEKFQLKITDFYSIEKIDEFSEKDEEESFKIIGSDEKFIVDFEEK